MSVKTFYNIRESRPDNGTFFCLPINGGAAEGSEQSAARYASRSSTTLPATSVSRKSRPWVRNVNCS